jgi:hypothetical protein
MIAAEVIVTSLSFGIVEDESSLGCAGAKGWLVMGGETSFTGLSPLGAVACGAGRSAFGEVASSGGLGAVT